MERTRRENRHHFKFYELRDNLVDRRALRLRCPRAAEVGGVPDPRRAGLAVATEQERTLSRYVQGLPEEALVAACVPQPECG